MCQSEGIIGKFSHCISTAWGLQPSPHDNSKHATEASVTLAQEVQNYQNKTQLMQCARHEIFSFSLGAALFSRLPALFLMTESVYFIRLFFPAAYRDFCSICSGAVLVLTCAAKVIYHGNKLLANKQAVEKLVSLQGSAWLDQVRP